MSTDDTEIRILTVLVGQNAARTDGPIQAEASPCAAPRRYQSTERTNPCAGHHDAQIPMPVDSVRVLIVGGLLTRDRARELE